MANLKNTLTKIKGLIDKNSFADAQKLCISKEKFFSEVWHYQYFFGLSLYLSNKKKESIKRFQKAVALGGDEFYLYFYLVMSYLETSQPDKALKSLQTAVEKIHDDEKHKYSAKIGKLFFTVESYTEGIYWYQKAILTNPNDLELYLQLAGALSRIQKPREAIKVYLEAFQLAPSNAKVNFNISKTMKLLRELRSSLKHYEIAFKLDPEVFDPAHALMLTCSLLEFDKRECYGAEIKKTIINGEHLSEPFSSLFFLDEPKLLLDANKNYSANFSNQPLCKLKKNQNSKIRIGYLSSDLKNHATSYLIRSLIQKHDRRRFEIFGFSYSVKQNTSYQAFIENSFDELLDVMTLTNHQVAEKIVESNIDILVDLKGHTESSRPGILRLKPAKIQINYLGYPGTSGIPEMDYIIGDRIVTPHESSHNFSEKIVQLPCCYQPNDPWREVTRPELITRKDAGLPGSAFTFCCFNHHWKYTPEIMRAWAEILKRCPDSVLWLLQPIAEIDFKSILSNFKIPQIRVITAPIVPIEKHLARIALADLFLDTFPCGAHTTASDALFANVPVLTIQGNSFHSRVSSSIMWHSNGAEMICGNQSEYVEKAIAIYQNKNKLEMVKTNIGDFQAPSSPYNIETTTLSLEKAYESILNLSKPEPISIEPWWNK